MKSLTPNRVPSFPCPEPGCGGKMLFGPLSKKWKDGQSAKGRASPNFAYFCTNRKSGCKGLVLAHDDGAPKGAALSRETRDLRKACHVAFDRIWRSADSIPAYRKQFSNLRQSSEDDHRRAIITKMRRVSYFFMAHNMGVPESLAHLSKISDNQTLRAFLTVAARTTAQQVWEWWEGEGKARYGEEFKATVKAAREFRLHKKSNPALNRRTP